MVRPKSGNPAKARQKRSQPSLPHSPLAERVAGDGKGPSGGSPDHAMLSYQIGSVCLPIGIGLLFGSTQTWWPTLPSLASHFIVMIGFVLILYGLMCFLYLIFVNRSDIISLFFVKYSNVLAVRSILPLFFICVTVSLAWEVYDRESGGVSIFLELPKQIVLMRGVLDTKFIITNNTDEPIMVSDFRMINVDTNNTVENPSSSISYCSDERGVLLLRDSADDASVDNPPLPMAGPDRVTSIYRATSLSINGDGANGDHASSIAPHQSVQVGASFAQVSRDNRRWNSETLCPSFKLVSSSFGRREVTCPGGVRTTVPASQYNEASKHIPKGFYGSLWLANPPSIGLVYAYIGRVLKVTNDEHHGYCR